jgi:hypothetical protein
VLRQNSRARNLVDRKLDERCQQREDGVQKTNAPKVVSLGDLGQLTMRANVVFAVRCAQRSRPLFKLPADAARRSEHLAAVDSAIYVASLFCGGLPLEAGRAAAALAQVHVTVQETAPFAGYAGYAALRAAEATVHAVEALRNRTQFELVQVVAGAFGAGRVLAANAGADVQDLVVAALFADKEKLSLLGPGTYGDLGPAIDPSESGPLGPLWPAGAPAWFAQSESRQESW